MRKFSYVITKEEGMHGRPSGVMVNKCSQFKSKITITSKNKSTDAKRILGVMALGVGKGDTVELTIEGEDETEAKEVLETFFKENF